MILQLSEKEIEKLAFGVVPNPDKIDLNSPSIQQAKKEVERCIAMPTGFLYFLLTYVFFKSPIGIPIPAVTNTYKWQKKAAIKFLMARYFIFFKTRQTGCSTLKQSHDLWRSLFFEGQTINVFSLGQDEANEYLEKMEFMYDNLPVWLKSETQEKNKSTIHFVNGSSIKSKPNTEKGSRSGTPSMIVLDEYAFYPKRTAGKLLGGSAPSLGPGSKAPFTDKTQPSQLFIISTLPESGTVDNEYMRIFNKAKEEPKESQYCLIEIETDDIPFYQDPQWHAEQLETLGQRKYDIEIRGIIHSQMENAFLSTDILNSITVENPKRCDFIRQTQVDEYGVPIDFDNFADINDDFEQSIGYCKGFWVWHDPFPGHYYGVCADVSSGGSTDYSGFHVIDLDTMEQVAEFKGKVSTPVLRDILKEVVAYYNNAKFCIERTGLGVTLCQEFGKSHPETFYFHKISKHKYVEGFPMGTNRGNVLGVFEKTMYDEEKRVKIKSIRTLNELRNFGYNARGRVEALEGANDDLTMALAEFIFLSEVFFFSENKLKQEIEELEAVKENDDVTRAKHFLFGGGANHIELTEESRFLIEQGYGIPVQNKN